MRKYGFLWIFAALAVVLGGCSAKSAYDSGAAYWSANQTKPMATSAPAMAPAPDMAPMPEASYNMSMEPMPEASYDMSMELSNEADYTSATFTGGAGASYGFASSGEMAERESKIIKYAYLSAETEDFDASFGAARELVSGAGGYLENSNIYVYDYVSDDRGLRRGSVTARVPSERYDEVVSGFSKLGKVTNLSENAQNATEQYYDVKARLEVKEAEEKRLLELIDKAERVEDLILLEQRLGNVRGDIEAYRSNLNAIDRGSDFSTVNLDLTERLVVTVNVAPTGFGEKIRDSFIGGVNATLGFFRGVILFVAGSLLPIAIILAVGIVALVVWKRGKKKTNQSGS